MSLKENVIKGVLWNFIEISLRRGLAIFTTLMLAWFIVPEEFGLLAILTVFISLSNILVDAGLSQALIRKSQVTWRELNTAFYTNICLSVFIYFLLLLSSPLIARFFDESRLEDLITVVSVVIIFNSFSIIQQVILSRELNFKLQLKVTLPAAVISSFMALVFAYLGFGVWALVVQILVQSITTTFLYWHLNLWRPKLEYSLKDFKSLFSFGSYLLIEQLSQVLFKNMYVVVIAKVYTSSVIGLYFFAERVRELLLNQLVNSIQKVTYPALSKVQSNNLQLKLACRQVVSVTTFILFPIVIFLAVFADTIFLVFLNESWQEASKYLQLLCFASLVFPLNSINLNILKVKGRSDLVFYLGVVKKTLAIFIFIITFKHGIEVIIIGQLISSLLGYIPNSYYSKKLINYSVWEQFIDFIPSLLLAGLIGIIIWGAKLSINIDSLIELFLFLGGATVCYCYVAWVMNYKSIKLLKEVLELKLKKQTPLY